MDPEDRLTEAELEGCALLRMMQSFCNVPAQMKAFLWPRGFPVTHFHPRSQTGTHLSDVKSGSNL